MACWARDVSACDGKLSNEHYFSSALLGELAFDVTGGPFGEGKRLKAAAMTTKSLCTKHNNDLSPLDQEAVDFASAVRRLDQLFQIRRKGPLKAIGPAAVALEVNGTRFERWCLKVMFGVLPLFSSLNDWVPPAATARAVFGLEALPKNCGLSFAHSVGDALALETNFGVQFGAKPSAKEPTGLVLTCLSWRFLCTWSTPTDQLYPVQIGNRVYQQADGFLFHPNRLKMTVTQTGTGREFPTNLFLDFLWGHPNRAPSSAVVRSRWRPGAD